MAYTISKTNGTTLIVLNDGLVDAQVTSINLIGKNVSNFGDAQNENFVKLLENFAFNVQPRRPLQGQIWFDSSDLVFRPAVYDGTNWRPLAVSLYSTTPTDVNVNAGGFNFAASRPGDFWFDSANKQLHVVTQGSTTATETVLIGPEQVTGYGTTKLVSAKMTDNNNIGRPVIQITVDGEVIGVISNSSFTQTLANPVPGFSRVYRGITFKNYSSSTRYTTATTDVQLHGLHEQLDPSYVRRNVDEHLQANWYVDNGYSLQFATTGTSSLTWDVANSDFNIRTVGKHRLQTNLSSLYFDGVQFYASTSTVNLGSSSNKFGTLHVNDIRTSSIEGTTASILTVSSNQLNAAAIRTQNANFDAGRINTNFTATNIFGGTINVTSATFGQTQISDGVFGTVSSIDATISDSASVANFVSANTYTGITVNVTEVFADRINVASTLTAKNLVVDGSPVVTTATISGLSNLSAAVAERLKGQAGTGNQQASMFANGYSIAQRGLNGELTATSIITSELKTISGTGQVYGLWSLQAGARLEATYADVAENYVADRPYESGTVLEFGGPAEVQVAEDSTRRVAGVVSTNPAHVLNASLTGENVITLALMGRVPVKVRGKVKKGDMLVSAGGGFARAEYSPILGSVIGKALEDFDGIEGVVEVVVGRL